MRALSTLFVIAIFLSCTVSKSVVGSFSGSELKFPELAQTWDEAMPLGNGMVGTLVWQKNGKLRFSLDRADLWDLRPMANIDFKKWKFDDVYAHWKADTYEEVQKAFDAPYEQLAAPTKIPGGALEFDIKDFGEIKSVSLDVETARCIVEWKNGVKLTTFVHAEKPIGWYKFENIETSMDISLVSPAYNRKRDQSHTSQISRIDLSQLGYAQGDIEEGNKSYTYNQPGSGDFSYQIHTQWEEKDKSLTGCWSVSSANKGWEPSPNADEVVAKEMRAGFQKSLNEHLIWWKNFWGKSAISIPDSLLEKQYYLELYKFGSAARSDAPPISLQAVWTADHGKLPPWKGDFHHDLNTQLSYWPAYAGNYLDLEEGFLNWLWKYRPAFKKYTKDFFGVDGMNVPGVTTLEGEPMGGWIQYSFGQTVAAWLSHHFYLHWEYTKDREFLKERAYPWLKEVSIFLDEIAVMENGKRKLKISSSPEIFDNSRKAWFEQTTNYDLALIRWNYEKAAELANELGLNTEADKWERILSEWPDFAVDEEQGLKFSPDFPYAESHRHFSHLMAFHPLGLIDFSKGNMDREIINNTLKNLREQGSDHWTGYSFSWQANLYARAFDGEQAAEALRIFAECFCLKNSFHVNGDQCKAGHSNFTYRPFTLEGNFAFASGIQEMLIQSHTGIVKLFPAIPGTWEDIAFDQLRTRGAFLVSAEMKIGEVRQVTIKAEKDGEINIENPFKNGSFSSEKKDVKSGDILNIKMKAGEVIILKE